MFASPFALVIVLVDCAASLHQGFRLREGVSQRDLAPMLPFIFAGMVAGAMILVRAPAGTLMVPLGNRWHSKITRAQAVRAIGVVLTLSGASLLLRAL